MEYNYTELYNSIKKCCIQDEDEMNCPVKNECIALWVAMVKIQDPPKDKFWKEGGIENDQE